MSNIVDYIKWRGDLSMEEHPINAIDELALAMLMYGVFTDIVQKQGPAVTMREAAEKYRQLHPGCKEDSYDLASTATYGAYVLFAMAKSRRFGDLLLSCYEDIFSPDEEVQFAAMQFESPGKIRSIVFRGTDNNIDSWREDFAISFSEVQAQKLAYEFVNRNMEPGYTYYLAGHSKGGNLAEYAAMECEDALKDQIHTIYSFDGPGICPEMTHVGKHDLIKGKVVKIVPEFSVVGMLFQEKMPDLIVKSTGSAILQHDAFTWQVEGENFVTVSDLDEKVKELNKIIDEWIEHESMEKRKAFTKGLFDSFKAGGAIDVQGIATGGIEGMQKIVKSLMSLDKEAVEVTVDLVTKTATGITQVKKETVLSVFKDMILWYAAVQLLLGIVYLGFPGFSMKAVGYLFYLQIFGYCAAMVAAAVVKLVKMKKKHDVSRPHLNDEERKLHRENTLRICVYPVIMALSIFCVLRPELVHMSTGVIIGMMFLVMSGVRGYTAVLKYKEREKSYGLILADAVLALVLAVLSFVFAGNAEYEIFLKVAGSYMVLMSFVEIFRDVLAKQLRVYKE